MLYEYKDGMLFSVTDYNGNVTSAEHDGTGMLISRTDALGGTIYFEHDAMLRITGITDELGGKTTYTYDKYGNLLTQTDPLKRTTVYEYDITGKKTADILPDGTRTEYSYDNAGSEVTMNMIDFFVDEYNEESWLKFTQCFKNADIEIDGVPQDVKNVLIELLGERSCIDWLRRPINQFDGEIALDLLLNEKGEKALKAFIMRMPN